MLEITKFYLELFHNLKDGTYSYEFLVDLAESNNFDFEKMLQTFLTGEVYKKYSPELQESVDWGEILDQLLRDYDLDLEMMREHAQSLPSMQEIDRDLNSTFRVTTKVRKKK